MAEEKATPSAVVASDGAAEMLPSKTPPGADEATHDDEGEGDEDEEGDCEAVAEGAASASAAAPKKKKKKSSKKKKTADATSPESTAAAAGVPTPVPVHDINSLLQQLSMSQPSKKDGKAPEDYKFWNTQPVPKFKEPNLLQTTSGSSLPEGAILPDQVCQAAAKSEPETLVDGFDWCLVDLNDKAELQELYDLLYNHYVEDNEGSFRFKYSPEFLSWALKVPGYKEDWHIGVRTKSDGKKGRLVAFIAGVPVKLKVRESTFNASEINFLAIHHKLRNKRLAPVLIKEVPRRCYRDGIYQALYTAGTVLPTPISTCRYFHRSLDWEHLHKTGFSHIPQNSSELRQKLRYKLETNTAIKGLRPMKVSDVPAVLDLLTRFNERYQLRQDFDAEEVEHLLCSKASKDVVWAHVVEEKGKITDFISYYLLESTVINTPYTIRAAYLFYYATDTAFTKKGAFAQNSVVQPRLRQLVHDALILAKKENFHVFNALTLQDNPLFLKDQKFEPGDGKLHYYLFNWRTALLPGGVNEAQQADEGKMGGIGIVML